MNRLVRAPLGDFRGLLKAQDHEGLGYAERSTFLIELLGQLNTQVQKACWLITEEVIPVARGLGNSFHASGVTGAWARVPSMVQLQALLGAMNLYPERTPTWFVHLMDVYEKLRYSFVNLGNARLVEVLIHHRHAAVRDNMGTPQFDATNHQAAFTARIAHQMMQNKDRPDTGTREIYQTLLAPSRRPMVYRVQQSMLPEWFLLTAIESNNTKHLALLLELTNTLAEQRPLSNVLDMFTFYIEVETHRTFVRLIRPGRLPDMSQIFKSLEDRLFTEQLKLQELKREKRNAKESEHRVNHLFRLGSIWAKEYLVRIEDAHQIHGHRHQKNMAILLALQDLEGVKVKVLEFLLPLEDAERLARLRAPTGIRGRKYKRVKPNFS